MKNHFIFVKKYIAVQGVDKWNWLKESPHKWTKIIRIDKKETLLIQELLGPCHFIDLNSLGEQCALCWCTIHLSPDKRVQNWQMIDLLFYQILIIFLINIIIV